MKQIFTFSILFTVLSCHPSTTEKGELFKGELFLKLIDIGPEIYTYPTKDGTTLKEIFDTTLESELTAEQKQGKKEYEFLKENGLIDKPYFNFSEDKSEIEFVKVYLNQDEYAKIKNINLTELKESGEKVTIKFYGTRVNENFIKCSKIEKVNKVRGEQKWTK